MNIFASIEKLFSRKEDSPPVIPITGLKPSMFAGQSSFAGYQSSIWDGGKFAGGFGETQLFSLDYWTLRKRSAQLFEENLYARGLIRRLVTNEINTGLSPDTTPNGTILGLSDDILTTWSEVVEARWHVWADNPHLCDYKNENTFGQLQYIIRQESLIEGDILVLLRVDKTTHLPKIQLISGSKIQTPFGHGQKPRSGNKIKHGVELNAKGQQVAYWVRQENGDIKRLAAFGDKSGRRVAWLAYGCDKRLDAVRGTPILSLVLQSLKELDRYRDATLRAEVIRSMIAIFIEKTEDKMGTFPITGGAVRKGSETVIDSDGETRKFNMSSHMPGTVIEELQQGEKPVPFTNGGATGSYGAFEESIIQAIAWANEVPPTILKLAYSSNYAASQAEIIEMRIYLNKVWDNFGSSTCSRVFKELVITETLTGKIQTPGLLDAWRDPYKYDIFGAWLSVVWYGSIKPSTDMLKQAKASEYLIEIGASTRTREARITTGTNYTTNIKQQKRENELLIESREALAQFKQQYGSGAETSSTIALDNLGTEIKEMIEEIPSGH